MRSIHGCSTAVLLTPVFRQTLPIQRQKFNQSCKVVISQKARRQSTIVAATAADVQSELPDGLPKGKSLWRKYETIICFNPTLNEEQRDQELAKLESFLLRQEVKDVQVMVKGRYKLAYPIKKHDEGIYALFTYTAKRAVAKAVEYFLAHPVAGTEGFILRSRTFVR